VRDFSAVSEQMERFYLHFTNLSDVLRSVSSYENFAQRVKDFKVKPDDVWLISYPKSGTTWCQEMIWLLCNNLDYERAKAEFLSSRFPFLE
jgi:Sulfotransferase domain